MPYKKNFIYISNIIHLPLLDSNGKKIGKIIDLTSVFQHAYPKVSGLLVKNGKARFHIPWENVQRFSPDRKAVILNTSHVEPVESSSILEKEILLKETFLDKQVVNIYGSKVVRVNDLQLLYEAGSLWLIHIDVGFKGFLRRLGFLKFINALSNWFISYELKDQFIPWKFVQPITTTNVLDSNYLKISFSKLSELHPADLADIIDDLGTEEGNVIFHSLDAPTAAKTLQELPIKLRVRMAENLDLKKLAAIIHEMQMDEVADLLDHFPLEKNEQLYSLLPMDKVVEIEELLSQSRLGAGSLMNSEFIAITSDHTVGEILKLIKTKYSKVESIYYIYIVDKEEVLLGVATLRELLTNPAKTPITEVMREIIVKVKIHANLKTVAEIFFKYDFTVVPVVDEQNHMKGIISMKDALEAVFPEIREEAEGKS
jgi:magnesium transporter